MQVSSQDGAALSVVVLALDDATGLYEGLPALRAVLDTMDVAYEIIVVARPPDKATIERLETSGVSFIDRQTLSYGEALRAGFAAAQGDYIITIDADFASRPTFIKDLWAKRDEAEVAIASRYVQGGAAKVPLWRSALSRALNIVFARVLSLGVRDMSSGFRLYAAHVLRNMTLEARNFDIVQEILTRAYVEGWRVIEVPFEYRPRPHGGSQGRVLGFGAAYLRTVWKLYRLRNSILSADYDARAYDSIVWPQRYWQRMRFRHITKLVGGQGATLDVGCGSSRIIGALPPGSVALDILIRKLRYARRFKTNSVQGSGFALPFPDVSFPCVLCSQVIEHVPKESPILDELHRVLKPGGRLVLGTPDYARWEWRATEAIYARVLPSAYADEHIAHYTRQELLDRFNALGYRLEATRYILRGELILAFRKPG
jgi:dolichol-phosphate mannosyltransferase